MKTLLVIDDDPAVINLVRAFFKASGWEVESARDGKEGLEKALRLKPRVILTDVVLPDMEGPALCRRVREDPEQAKTLILMISGQRKDSEAVVEGLKAGADDYLPKPVSLRLLSEKIEALLR